jgi:hypothetical protein
MTQMDVCCDVLLTFIGFLKNFNMDHFRDFILDSFVVIVVGSGLNCDTFRRKVY